MRLKKIIKDKKGGSTPLTVALILGLLLLICAISEFFRLGIIVQGVRDGLQQAVITVVTYDDVYYRLNNLLGTDEQDGYHIKRQAEGYEYRLSGLSVELSNAPLTPGNADNNLEADARITIEIPLSFGWEKLPPLQMELRTRSAYMPKF